MMVSSKSDRVKPSSAYTSTKNL